jgi:hypothetical protein
LDGELKMPTRFERELAKTNPKLLNDLNAKWLEWNTQKYLQRFRITLIVVSICIIIAAILVGGFLGGGIAGIFAFFVVQNLTTFLDVNKMTKLSFEAQLKTAGDIKVPSHIRFNHGLKKGEWFRVTLEKIHPKLGNDE